MTSFLFHKVSEKEKQEIKEQAKAIMDSFSRKLSKIDKKMAEPLIERDEGEREEGAPSHGDDLQGQRPQASEKSSLKIFTKGKKCDEDFRKIMFENAPSKNKDFIIGEKKSW